jgi:hypothetical protein
VDGVADEGDVVKSGIFAALAFLLVNAGLLGVWTSRQREALARSQAEDADSVARFAAERGAEGLATPEARAALEKLVAVRGLAGAKVVDAEGRALVAVGGEGRAVEVKVEGLRAVAVLDGAALQKKEATIRRRVVLVGVAASLFAPIVGFLVGRLAAARRRSR